MYSFDGIDAVVDENGTIYYDGLGKREGEIIADLMNDINSLDDQLQQERNVPAIGGDNARLMAAAPELLAACEAAMKHLDYTDPMGVESQEEKDLLDAAIRKARGE